MGVKLAETAGFCMGVKRAVDIVLDVAHDKGDQKIYTYGPLIHNPQTVELLEKRGVIPVESIDDVHEGTIIIRAHGISLDERQKLKEKGMKIIDATCPKVARVQSIIKKHASQGYTVIIAGDKDHPEVVGLLGYAQGRGVVVSDGDDIDRLSDFDKVCVVAQTTQNIKEYEEIIRRIKKKYPTTIVFDTVCDSTEKRQTEIRTLAHEMDAMVVVGGKNSANTRRLAEISRESGIPTFHIETADELKQAQINGYNNVGISAGASTPNWIIDGVIDYIAQYREEKGQKRVGSLYKLWLFTVKTDIYSSIGAGCLSLVGTFVQGLSFTIFNVLMASSYVFAMHTINRVQDKYVGRIRGSFREETYVRYKKVFVAVGVSSLLLSLVLAFISGVAPFLLLLFISVLGMFYNIEVFPRSWRFTKLGDLPGSKTVFVALAWAIVTVVVPQSRVSLVITPEMVTAFLFIFTVVFVKSSLSDMLEIQSDRFVGRETIPVVIGEKKTKELLIIISLIVGMILVASVVAGYASPLNIVLLISIFYVWICIKLCDMRTQFSSIVLEGLLETNFIIAGLGGCLWVIFST